MPDTIHYYNIQCLSVRQRKDSCNILIIFSFQGFGDILVPGLLLSFAHSYDLLAGIRYKLYWVITVIAYILGLVATFVSLFLMNSAQPALLYLVPFTLVPTLLVAWIRGDLGAMWTGDSQVTQSSNLGNMSKDTYRGYLNILAKK